MFYCHVGTCLCSVGTEENHHRVQKLFCKSIWISPLVTILYSCNYSVRCLQNKVGLFISDRYKIIQDIEQPTDFFHMWTASQLPRFWRLSSWNIQQCWKTCFKLATANMCLWFNYELHVWHWQEPRWALNSNVKHDGCKQKFWMNWLLITRLFHHGWDFEGTICFNKKR